MTDGVRTRFAPSPTGYLHVGGARTALYNYLYARRNGGTFLLRIEDTDQKRSEESMTTAILDSMTWLGITWDEGPIFQSKRLDLYRQTAEELLTEGVAYWHEDPEKGRAIKMRMPKKIIRVSDLIHDVVEFDGALAEDFVIIKSDGYPSYNFACVIDDTDLAITHVIRGDEHLSNMPRQLALYEALGYTPPKFAHIPMILGPDGAKLSKRHGATSVGEYRDRGFLPEALANFVALLGWSPGNDLEIMSLAQMVELFTIERCRPVSSRFDHDKLLWMNGQYIMSLPVDRLATEMRDYLGRRGADVAGRDDDWLKHLALAYRERIKTLEELYEKSRVFFADEYEYDPAAVKKVLAKDGAANELRALRETLSGVSEWRIEALEAALKAYCEASGKGFGKVAQPLRVAITGTSVSPPMFETLVLLGRERTLSRIDRTLGRMDELTAQSA